LPCYSHFKSSSRMFLKADGMPFSTDYTEWGLRSSERDCEGPLELAMIVDESDEARPRHRDGHGHQDPGHRHFLLRYRKGWSAALFDTDFGRSLDRKSTCEREHLFEGPAGGADPSTGGTDNPRRGEGPRRGRRQGGASRAPRLSSARSAPTRRRARSRRRRSSARQRTGRPLVK